MSFLEQDITKKGQVENMTLQLEFEGNSKGEKYEIERIWDSAIYTKKLKCYHLPSFYYLVL